MPQNNSVILKTYIQSDNEQLGMCTARQKDKNFKYTFFVVPAESPVLLWMSVIELLNILKIMCEVIGDPHESR